MEIFNNLGRISLASIAQRVRNIAVIIAVIVPISAMAQLIEIKGLRVGMTKAEVQEKFPTWKDFTIAGVRSKFEHLPVTIKYREDQLDQLMFIFSSASFQPVLAAVKEKYPGIKCETSQVGNSIGATFEQIHCSMEDQDSVLQLSRYLSDVRTSMLTLVSKRWLDEQADKAKQKKKDI